RAAHGAGPVRDRRVLGGQFLASRRRQERRSAVQRQGGLRGGGGRRAGARIGSRSVSRLAPTTGARTGWCSRRTRRGSSGRTGNRGTTPAAVRTAAPAGSPACRIVA